MKSSPRAAAPAQAEAPASTFPTPMAPAGATPATGFADVNTDNSLISNGSVSATSEKLLSTASAFRREVYRLGGRVYAEQVHFRTQAEGDASEASAATYRIKILPRLLPDVLDWLGTHATITAQDVSSIIAMESEADASIARVDVQHRLDEIAARLAEPDLEPPQRAALEQERARLTGAVIADPSAMADNTKRVAVLDIRFEAPHRADPYAHGQMVGHARGSLIDLGVLGVSGGSRVGGGVGIGGRSPVSALEVLGYAASSMDEHAGVTVTLGAGGYSRALGGGNRRLLNPYLGARLGYAYLQASYLEVAAEVGVELVKQDGVVWTVSARPMGLLGSGSKAAVELGSSIGLAF
ncbi:MAG TPA: hypothetical protein VF469_14445 [Kofleriaceae bacterium]